MYVHVTLAADILLEPKDWLQHYLFVYERHMRGHVVTLLERLAHGCAVFGLSELM